MKKYFTLALFYLLISTYQTNAQGYLGVANSNYSAIDGLFLNPSSIADSRHKFSLNLYSINAFGNNNELSFDYRNLIKDGRNKDSIQLGRYLKSIVNKNIDLTLPFLEVRGPSLFYSINKKNSIGLITRMRLLNQFNNFDGQVFNALAHGYVNTGNAFAVNDKSPYYWTSHLVTDLGISYATVLLDNGKNFLKAGVTAKLYRGSAIVFMDGKNIDGTYYPQPDSLAVNSVDFTLKTDIKNDKANQLNNFNSYSGFYDQFFGKSAATGFGGDLGLTYEYRPDAESYYYTMDGDNHVYDNTVNKYKFKVTASVLDIGYLKYKNIRELHVTGSGQLPNLDNFDFSNYSVVKQQLADAGFTLDERFNKTLVVNMPTSAVIGLDVKAAKNIYVNATYLQSVVNKKESAGNYYASQVSLVPRYETRLFDVGIPITYNASSKDVKAGLGFRIGFLTIGSDDLLGLTSSKSKGFNFYFGARINIANKKPKDSDKDLVSDKHDNCKFEKGVWEYKGCPIPDTDGDGILDKDDLCPTVAGVKSAQGCPDKDGDGIADNSDLCPDVFGAAQFNGCPDTDGDGVPDKDDKCPNEKGDVKFNGCPDTDGDGIADPDDKCPKLVGTLANEGCPDTDGDGVHDGIDKCPTKVGPASNSGCPVISVEVKKRLAFAATAIQFDFGKATIKKNSNKLLDEIVAILNEYSDYNMTIDGHTDNVGDDASNLILSKNRAAAVRDYFISKGIVAERLVSEGYGESKPVETNKTAAGRAKNRRVDMDLKLK